MAAEREYIFRKSKLLSEDENGRIHTILGPRKECLAMTIAQIFASDQTSSVSRERILCFIKDHATKSFFFYIYCNSTFNLIWKENLKKDLGYVRDNDLHTFKVEGLDIGIKFKSRPEGATFVKEVRSKFLLMDIHGAAQLEAERKKKKERVKPTKSRNKKGLMEFTVGDPQNFKHVTHISSIFLDKEDIRDVFLKAGIEKEKLNSRLTKQLLEAVIEAEKNSHTDSTVSVPEIKILDGETRAKKKAPPRPPPPKLYATGSTPSGGERVVARIKKSDDFDSSDEIILSRTVTEKTRHSSNETVISGSVTEKIQTVNLSKKPSQNEIEGNQEKNNAERHNSANNLFISKQSKGNIPREEMYINNIPRKEINITTNIPREEINITNFPRKEINITTNIPREETNITNFPRKIMNITTNIPREEMDVTNFPRKEMNITTNKPREEMNVNNIPQAPPIEDFFNSLDGEDSQDKPEKTSMFGVGSIIEQGKMLRPVGELKVRPVEVEKRLDNLADIMRDFMSKIRPSIENDDDVESDENEWN